MDTAAEITRNARSNLAFALRVIPRENRADVTTFYAFCRVVDDIADDPHTAPDEKSARLRAWAAVVAGTVQPSPGLQRAVVELRERRNLPTDFLEAIIEGCRRDIVPRIYQTWEELDDYIWHVAGAVGLVSVRLFGCTDPRADDHAIQLAKALQLTNILRDVREDYENGGRVYLPRELLENHGVTPTQLALEESANTRAVLAALADRAENCFRNAAGLLPPGETKRLLPARIMAATYHTLLGKIRADGFQVARKRYRLSRSRLLYILLRQLTSSRNRLE